MSPFIGIHLKQIHIYSWRSLPAKFADSVDLKGGLLNNMICTVKFLVVELYFSCNTTHTV